MILVARLATYPFVPLRENRCIVTSVLVKTVLQDLTQVALEQTVTIPEEMNQITAQADIQIDPVMDQTIEDQNIEGQNKEVQALQVSAKNWPKSMPN